MRNATLEIPIYETPDGLHTCAVDWPSGKVCQFLYTVKLGFREHCFFDGKKLERGDGGTGYIVPWEGCPLRPKKGA